MKHSKRLSRRRQRRQRRKTMRRKQRGGNLPVPPGSVVAMSLDPKDEYSAPVLVTKESAEEDILD